MFHSKQDVDRHVNEVFKNIKNENQRNLKCYQIAKLYYKFKDFNSAIKYLNRYIVATSSSAAAHRLLGDCYLGNNSKVKALDSYKASLELNGSQHDLVLKVCTLLMDPEVSTVTPRATYWLERAESLFPTNSVVFRLREHLLKSNLDGKQDSEQLEKLILSEIRARPTDVTVRIRLLNFFLETKRFKIAYQHALEIEERNIFSNDHRWYDCLCNVVQAYEKSSNDITFFQNSFIFFIKKVFFLERRVDLFMQEFHDEVKTLPECSSALFALDQSLYVISKIEIPNDSRLFFDEFMKHIRAQLSFHFATLALKRAKKEYGVWSKAVRTASPLLLQATQNTMDLDDAWYSMWTGKKKLDREVKQWNKSASLRISQAGHVLLAWSINKGSKFLEMVSQFCGGKWQAQIYQDVFYNKEHQQNTGTSCFINDSSFSIVPMQLLNEIELNRFDEVAQSAYPDSLHHLVWLGLAHINTSGQLSHNFRCMIVPDLQFTIETLSQTGPETLNQLDVDAFLYASVLCAKSATPNVVNNDRPNKLPVNISEELCSPAQADWWSAVYGTYKSQQNGNIADVRLKLIKGIETIRALGQHGLHVKLIVMLAKLFQERAAKNTSQNELNGLEDRAYLYWSAAIPMLEKIERNQQVRVVPNRLFDYKGKDLTSNETKMYLEDGKLFLACRLMKQGRHEQAVEAFQSLKSPYATFYQGIIYEKLASVEVNHRPESITSENRAQNIILLTQARDAFYVTLDRLRSPSANPEHPLNALLLDHLDETEKKLARIDPDSSRNKNGDTESGETDTVPRPLSPDLEENFDTSFNVYNTSSFLNAKNQGTPRNIRHNISERHQNTRFEARPSPERLDAQLRYLVLANSNGLKGIVEQLKEMKSTMQIELKDLGCVTRDLLAEMKKLNHRLEATKKDSMKPEELFDFREEDYEDFNQISQQYLPYQNYQISRPATVTQGTATVTYGTPVPSPVPPIIPAGADNILLSQPFYSGTQNAGQIDPSVLLYQTLGYYGQGLPFPDNQISVDYRGAGAQKELPKKKGIPFKNNSKGNLTDTTLSTLAPSSSSIGITPNLGSFVSKPQPPNVVITSSDTLPAFTNVGTPVMSVTIPPQHIRALTPTTISKSNHNQVHPFQIQMPTVTHSINSPAEKLNSAISTTSTIVSPVQTSISQPTVVPKPILNDPSLFKGVSLTPKIPIFGDSLQQKQEESKKELKSFECKTRLFVLDNQSWKDEGNVYVKINMDKSLQKVKIIFLKEVSVIYIDNIISPNMILETMKNSERAFILIMSNYHRTDMHESNNFKGVKETWQKFCLQFSTKDEAKKFENSFKEGCNIMKENFQTNVISIPPQAFIESKTFECGDCKKPHGGSGNTCDACEKKKSNEKMNVGGFTFSSAPTFKPPTLKLNDEKENQKEVTKPSPFAEFSFSTPADSKTSGFPSFNPKSFSSLLTSDTKKVEVNENANLFAGVKADPNSFKKDSNFKFEGEGSFVFGSLNAKKFPSKPNNVSSTVQSTNNEDEEGENDDYEPSSDFAPVVDLPPLVDVSTGEENYKILFSERAKLLRFDTGTKEWKERGVGDMKILLNEEIGKVRLIMRRELVFKVCCNHYLDENMEFKPLLKSEKALSWYAQDYSEADLKAECFALKFKSVKSMQNFLSVVKNTQSTMKNGRIKGIIAEKPQKEDQKDLKPLSEMFKPKPGSWECGTCLIRNNEKDTKCVSCETPKPGSEPNKNETSGKNSLGKGITLPPSTFTFGIPPQSTTKSESSVSVLTPPQNFTFGIPQTTVSAIPTFGSGDFLIRSSKLGTSTSSTISVSTPISTFTQVGTSSSKGSSNSATVSNFTFGMKPINTSATSLTAPVSQSGTLTTSSTTKFTISSPDSKSFKDSNIGSIFGGTVLKESQGPQPPLFGFNIPKTDQNTLTTTKPAFSIGPALQPQEKETEKLSPKDKAAKEQEAAGESEAEEDNGDHIIVKPIVPLPDKVDEKTGEEDEDLLYKQSCKLYRFVNKEWKEKGVGDVKILKHKSQPKIRLLMRREIVLKVCLNHYLTPEIEFTPKNEKTWQWHAPDFSEGEVRFETLAIRFKTAEMAQEFMQAIENAKKETSSEPKEPTKKTKKITFGFGTMNVSQISKPTKDSGSDEDLLVVYEKQVTSVQKEKAMSLQLPPNFYSYMEAPKCPGCCGCDPEENAVLFETPQITSSTISTTKTNTQPLFGSVSSVFGSFSIAGTQNEDADDESENDSDESDDSKEDNDDNYEEKDESCEWEDENEEEEEEEIEDEEATENSEN